MHKVGGRPSLAFQVRIFPEVVRVVFRVFSGAVAPVHRVPVKFSKNFVRIKVRFFPWKPPITW